MRTKTSIQIFRSSRWSSGHNRVIFRYGTNISRKWYWHFVKHTFKNQIQPKM